MGANTLSAEIERTAGRIDFIRRSKPLRESFCVSSESFVAENIYCAKAKSK
jgi:hypothetical protein